MSFELDLIKQQDPEIAAAIQGEIDRLDKKLSNAGFVAKAPAQVVEAEKVKLAQYKAQLDGIAEAKAKLENAHK